MFSKILIANRGEIACRVMASAKRMGIQTVAVYSTSDAHAKHVHMADEAYHLGGTTAQESYLNQARILQIATQAEAQAIHPGYGFLSENAHFAKAVTDANLCFIGPSPEVIAQMGLKDAAKALMEKHGIAVVKGYHGSNQQAAFLGTQAASIGYPVLIKARAGGGGKGMRKVEDHTQFAQALASAKREAKANFDDDHVLIEKYIASPRHIEVQVFGDSHGNVVHVFERDCSIQRRHQKVIEEAPAPGVDEAMRQALGDMAVKAAKAIGYCGAGTVEFIADTSAGLHPKRFYFMEMNTRLQVEHPITECISAQDLVEWQLRVAWGEPLPLTQAQLCLQGWAFEARIYAEDTQKGFLPASGKLDYVQFPKAPANQTLRVESGVVQGDSITPFYDPMIAKLVIHAATREIALARMRQALAHTQLVGTKTNLAFLQAVFAHPAFVQGGVKTDFIEQHTQSLLTPATPPPHAVALAALSALGLTQPPASTSPWASLRNWHGWQPPEYHVTFAHHHQDFEVHLLAKSAQHYQVTYHQQTLTLQLQTRGNDAAGLQEVVALVDNQRLRAKCLTHQRNVMVWLDAGSFCFALPPPLNTAKEAHASNTILAPISGVVKLVAIKEGASVQQGEALLMVEAMKMEHTLTAPRDGVIKGIHTSQGTQVQEGEVLLTLVKPSTSL